MIEPFLANVLGPKLVVFRNHSFAAGAREAGTCGRSLPAARSSRVRKQPVSWASVKRGGWPGRQRSARCGCPFHAQHEWGF